MLAHKIVHLSGVYSPTDHLALEQGASHESIGLLLLTSLESRAGCHGIEATGTWGAVVISSCNRWTSRVPRTDNALVHSVESQVKSRSSTGAEASKYLPGEVVLG